MEKTARLISVLLSAGTCVLSLEGCHSNRPVLFSIQCKLEVYNSIMSSTSTSVSVAPSFWFFFVTVLFQRSRFQIIAGKQGFLVM